MSKKSLALLLAALQAATPLLTYAQTTSNSLVVQIPLSTVAFTASHTTYSFGNVLVGQHPQHAFTFFNRGSTPTTVNSVMGLYNGSLVTDNCTGKVLQGGESCTVVGALNVSQAITTAGELQVSHSASDTPDVFAMTATGVVASGIITSSQSFVDFGATGLNQLVGPQSISFRNTGDTPVSLLDLTLSEGSSNFSLEIDSCITTLNPGDSCSINASFRPQALGTLQGRVTGLLDDGSEVTLTNLSGAGVQGTPTWTATQINFLDGVVGVKSDNQVATLTNSGRGPLTIASKAITGDASFKLESTTCGSALQPGESCSFQISNTPPDSSIHSGYLEVQTTNSSLRTSRIQLYSRPSLPRAVLSVDPVTLDFGDLAVGSTKTLTVSLRSTGNVAANVSQYTLGGTGQTAFSVLNASSCTGSLAPNMECVLQVQARPLAVGAQSGTLAVVSDTPDPVPNIQLKANGLGPSVSADKVTLSFGTVTQGDTPTLSAVLTNTGGAPAKLNSITQSQGAAAFTYTQDTSGACVAGGTLAAGASCKLNVTFLTSGVTGAQSGSFVMNFDSGVISIGATGTVAQILPPTATLSTFACPTSVTVGAPFSCTGIFTNTSTSSIALNPTGALTLSNLSFGTGLAAPSSDCPSEAAGGLAPGRSCTVTINGKATSAIAWQTNVTANFKRVGTFAAATLSQNSSSASASASTGAQTPTPQASLTDFTCDVMTAQIGVPYVCTATLSSGGNTALTLTSSSFTLNTGSRNIGTVSTDCPATLAVGGTCKVTLQGTISMGGTNPTTVTVTSNATTVSKQINLTGTFPQLQLTTTNPPSVQYGDTATAVQTLTNKGSWAVSLTKAATITGSGLSITGTTCGSSLAAGASCTITTSCTPSATSTSGLLTTYPSATSSLQSSGYVSCTGVAPQVRLESATGEFTFQAGAYSTSGNWYRVVNTGIGPVTITGIGIGSPTSTTTFDGFALYYDTTKADHCGPGKVIPTNGSCIFLLTGYQPPNDGKTVLLQVKSTANPLDYPQGIGTAQAVSVALTKSFPVATVAGGVETGEFTLTNQAKWTLTDIQPQLSTANVSESGKGFVITGNTCTSLAPAGQAGSSCKITVTFNAPSTPVTAAVVSLNVKGSYPQVINGVGYAPVSSGPQGAWTTSVRVDAAKLTFTSGTFAPIGVGETATATSTLRNDSSGAVSVTGSPSVDLPYYRIQSSTCSGTIQPGQSCQVVVQFTPTAISQSAAGTVSIPTSGGVAKGMVAGQFYPQTDVTVRVSNAATRVMPQDTTLWNVTVSNTVAGTANVGLTLSTDTSGGASISSRGTPTCTVSNASSSCTVNGNALSLVLQAGASATVSQTVTYGATEGQGTMTATITPTQVIDSNSSNNTATGTIPVAFMDVSSVGGVTNYSPAMYSAEAVRNDGSLSVVGYNGNGWLGTGADPVYKNFGTSANKGWISSTSATADVVAVSGRAQVASIIKSDGSAWLAGSGGNGNFGYTVSGTVPNVYTFTKVFDGAVQVIPETLDTVILKKDGTVWVAGNNASGQMGLGNTTARTGFVKVFDGARAVAAGNGGKTIFALKGDGTLWATGDNSMCQMGTGNTTSKTTFAPIASNVAAVSAGTGHTLILRTDGSVMATGNNSHSQLGTGNYQTSCTFVTVMNGATAISAGYNQSAVIGYDGYLYMAGANDSGQLGSASTRVGGWGKYTSLGTVSSVVTGYANTMVQKSDGSLYGTGMFSHPSETGLKYSTFTKLNP